VHARRPTSVALLAALYAVSGALCLLGAIRPTTSETPVALQWVLGAIGLIGGACLWAFGARLRARALHATVAVTSLLIGLLAWQSATPVGIVGLGPVVLAVGLYAAHFFSPRAARVHVLLLVVLVSAGAWATRLSGFVVEWIALVVAAIAMTEVQARLALHLRTAAATDPLTGVANRRAWESEAARSLAHATRTGEPLTFAILDLDDFKGVNDRLGHGAGDQLLRELATGWTHRLRGADLLGRYGGDEFVLCLPGTDRSGAEEILERLAASHEFAWSGGVATLEEGDTLGTVLARADADLYRQKRSGRGV
jgi:diguanylate cyclase (GGDEF)-like protein